MFRLHHSANDDDGEESYESSVSSSFAPPPPSPYEASAPPPEPPVDLSVEDSVTANAAFNVKSYARSSRNYVWQSLHNETLAGSGANVIGVSVTDRCTPSWFFDAFCVNLEMQFANRSIMEEFMVDRLDRNADARFSPLRDASTVRVNRWEPSDYFRWNTDIFRNDDHRLVAHLHSWSTDTREVTFLYHEESRVAYNTITVDKRSRRAKNASQDLHALDILIVPDAPPREVLDASPVWKDVIDLQAYDDRLSWILSGTRVSVQPFGGTVVMPAQTLAFGRIQKDAPVRIVIDDIVSTDFVFELQDTFGYGLCMPAVNRYVAGGGTQSNFAMIAHPHFGYFSVVSRGITVSSGASFSQIPTLQMPKTYSSLLTFRLPHAPASAIEGCSSEGGNGTVTNGRQHRRSVQSQIATRARANTTARVVGGDPVANQGEYGFMVSIQRAYDKQQNSMHAHLCGGSLVAPDLVLTAAHCVYPNGRDWPDNTNCFTDAHHVDVGRITLTESAEAKCIEEIVIVDVYIHPKYDPNSLSYDFALLRLGAKSSYRPIRIFDTGDENHPKVDFRRMVVSSLGWGHTAYAGHMSDDLMIMHTFVYDREECKRNYANVVLGDGSKAKIVGVVFDDHNFCAYHKIGNTVIDSCQGDSGGAMFFHQEGEFYIIGVVSFGYECAYRHSVVPGVYANVTHVADWVNTYMPARRDLHASSLSRAPL
ncbi:hypothetical protein CYMTET_16357 [Cymbomonas tetramitiformis]|uniref:Peptidase S1 domain-containing protein n=1 Tax=Cymbomonas tetramitiformis TaxID=36881 RepID=A0AAE0GCE0_9CHLO|nr:hypothetical protein CYMTET_16357 [Cymbomonas tetramitiformis]